MTDTRQPIVLSIAGSDNTGGAGIQADIKTCCAYKVYAATVITGVTAQNSRKVFGVEPVSLSMISQQIDSIFEVMRPDAVKTGMLPSPEIIRLVGEKLRQYDVRNIVVDPVMVATNGGELVKTGNQTIEAFVEHLLPIADIVTPNISEASEFFGKNVRNMDAEAVCRRLKEITGAKSVLLKGGHSSADAASDYLFDGTSLTEFSSQRIVTDNTHGTGCTLSSAIACSLAMGKDIKEAVAEAKEFISEAIASASNLKIMEGPGPLDFFVNIE